jgi:hypothetical protein
VSFIDLEVLAQPGDANQFFSPLKGERGMEMDEATTREPQTCHSWESRRQEACPQGGTPCAKLFSEREASERYVLSLNLN